MASKLKPLLSSAFLDWVYIVMALDFAALKYGEGYSNDLRCKLLTAW
jgi:hypothetical protein